MTEALVVVFCPRKDDPTRLEIPGARERACDECGLAIMVTPAALERVRGMACKLVCVEHMPRLAEGMRLLPPSVAQLEERARSHPTEGFPRPDLWGKKLHLPPERATEYPPPPHPRAAIYRAHGHNEYGCPRCKMTWWAEAQRDCMLCYTPSELVVRKEERS